MLAPPPSALVGQAGLAKVRSARRHLSWPTGSCCREEIPVATVTAATSTGIGPPTSVSSSPVAPRCASVVSPGTQGAIPKRPNPPPPASNPKAPFSRNCRDSEARSDLVGVPTGIRVVRTAPALLVGRAVCAGSHRSAACGAFHGGKSLQVASERNDSNFRRLAGQ